MIIVKALGLVLLVVFLLDMVERLADRWRSSRLQNLTLESIIERSNLSEQELAALHDKSVESYSPEIRFAIEMALYLTREPVVSVMTREENEGRALQFARRWGWDEPGQGYYIMEVDLEVTTAEFYNPIAGFGHKVKLNRTPDGGWRVKAIEEWRA